MTRGYDVQIDPSGEIVAVLHEDGEEVDRIPAPPHEAEQIGQEWSVNPRCALTPGDQYDTNEKGPA